MPGRPLRRAGAGLALACLALVPVALPAAAQPSASAAPTAVGLVPPAYARTIGGPGHAQMYPSGLDVGPDGTIYVADTGNDKVSAYTPAGQLLWSVGIRGRRVLGGFDNPRDVAVTGNRLFVADTGYQRVQEVDARTGRALRVWPMSMQSPMGISTGVDPTGRNVVLVTEGTADRVSVFSPAGALIRRIGTSGSGAGQLQEPRDAALDAFGRVYVADYLNNRVALFTSGGAWITAWGSTGTAPGKFLRPYGVDTDATGRVYVADSNNFRIQVFTRSGDPLRVIGSKGTAAGQFAHLRRVAVGPGTSARVYGADLWGLKIEEFSPSGAPVRTFGGTPPPKGRFNQVGGLVIDGELLAVDSVNQRVQRFSRSLPTTFLGSFGHRGWGSDLDGFNWPRDLAADTTHGTLWIADTKNSRVIEVTRAGVSTGRTLGGQGVAPGKMNWPLAIAASAGDLFVADTLNNRVQRWDIDTASLMWTAGGLDGPSDVTLAGGKLYVADARNRRIARLNPTTGAFIDSFGQGVVHYPTGVAVTASGSVWVADRTWNQVVEFGADLAWRRSFGSLGTAHGSFNTPAKVEVSAGELYVSDQNNDRIEIFSLAGS